MGSKYEINAWGFDGEKGDYDWVKKETADTWEDAQRILREMSEQYHCVALYVRTDKRGLI